MGGGQQQGGGGDIMSAIGRMMGGGAQGVGNYQQVFTGGVPLGEGNPNASPPDFPAADMGDPFGGISPGDARTSPFGLANISGFGQNPSFGGPSQGGPTQLPTWWNNYPGVGNVPFAVPVGGWNPPVGEPSSSIHFRPKNQN
jgi:hypothetical protein